MPKKPFINIPYDPERFPDLDDYILKLDSWHTPATDYARKRVGNFRIHRGKQATGTYSMRGIDDYLLVDVKKTIPITYLQEKRGRRWCAWMTDFPADYRAMCFYARQAKGKVLTTGLGLGLYLHGLANNPDVEQITVIEKSPEVRDLIIDYLPRLPRLKIVLNDFYKFLLFDQTHWDTILVDLWVFYGEIEKQNILDHEVSLMKPILKLKYPKASISFHGFQAPFSDMDPMSDKSKEAMKKFG